MPCIFVEHLHFWRESDALAIFDHSSGESQYRLDIVLVIQRLFDPFLLSSSLCLFKSGLEILLHQMGSIQKHDLHEIESGLSGYDLATKTLFVQQWDPTHMIQMAVGD